MAILFKVALNFLVEAPQYCWSNLNPNSSKVILHRYNWNGKWLQQFAHHLLAFTNKQEYAIKKIWINNLIVSLEKCYLPAGYV